MKILKSRSIKLFAIATLFFMGMATTVVNNSGNYFEIAKNIEIFTNLYKEVNTYYVDELDPAKLMKTGVMPCSKASTRTPIIFRKGR